MKRISGGQLSREAKPRFYQVTPAVLGRRRTTQALPVRPKQSTQQSRVSPPPARGPTGRVGRHRPDAHHSDSDRSLVGLAEASQAAASSPSLSQADRTGRYFAAGAGRPRRRPAPRYRSLSLACDANRAHGPAQSAWWEVAARTRGAVVRAVRLLREHDLDGPLRKVSRRWGRIDDVTESCRNIRRLMSAESSPHLVLQEDSCRYVP